MSSVWGNDKTKFFHILTPDKVLDAVDKLHFNTTGRVMALNSMENRVYEVEIENSNPKTISENFKIAKFYRPGRWTKEQILDEHQFLNDLVNDEIEVIAPDCIDGQTLFETEDGLYYCLFPKKGGRPCDEWNEDLLQKMGRLLARLHNTGRLNRAQHRLELNIDNFGFKNLETLKSNQLIPKEYESNYFSIANQILVAAKDLFTGISIQRIHGDCHHGNVLIDKNPFLIDFDDMSNGPKVQDIWMISPGRDSEAIEKRNILLDAYESMGEFDYRELKLIEVLRALRVIHFSAWIGLRFDDRAFQFAFPHYKTPNYWENEIQFLREQLEHINKAQNQFLY